MPNATDYLQIQLAVEHSHIPASTMHNVPKVHLSRNAEDNSVLNDVHHTEHPPNIVIFVDAAFTNNQASIGDVIFAQNQIFMCWGKLLSIAHSIHYAKTYVILKVFLNWLIINCKNQQQLNLTQLLTSRKQILTNHGTTSIFVQSFGL